jgi:hypothetical protein
VAQALSSDPTLKAEIDYEMKLFEKNSKEKEIRDKVAAAAEAANTIIQRDEEAEWNSAHGQDENISSGNIINNTSPKTGRPETPKTKQKLTFNIPSSSSVNATPNKNHMTPNNYTPSKNTPSKNTPGKNTPSKHIKDVMFLSPMKSSKKSNVDGGGSDRKGKNGVGESTYAMITKRNDLEEENDGEEADEVEDEVENSVQMRQKRRRSWGVVVSNLDDADGSEETSSKKEELKVKNKSKKEKKEIREFEIRYTPLKKRMSGGNDESGSDSVIELVKEIDLNSIGQKEKKNKEKVNNK